MFNYDHTFNLQKIIYLFIYLNKDWFVPLCTEIPYPLVKLDY